VAGCPTYGTAQTNWQAVGTGDFQNPANWSAGVPTSGTDASIVNGTVVTPTIVNLSSGKGSVLNLSVDSHDTLNVGSGSSLAVYGTQLNNSGSLTINGGGGNDGFLYLPANLSSSFLTVEGGGSITLNSGDSNGQASIQPIVFGGGTFVENVDNVIQGYGSIGTGRVGITNDTGGTIDANVSGQMLSLTAGFEITNTGILEASGGGILQLTSLVDNKNGTILADGGTVLIQIVQGGAITTKNGGQVLPQFTGSVLDGNSNGAITLTAGSTFAIDFSNGPPVATYGSLANQGNIQIGGASSGGSRAALVVYELNLKLSGGGTVTLTTNSAGQALIQEENGDVSLINVDNTIQGSGIVGYSGQPTFFDRTHPDGWDGLSIINESHGIIDANIAGQGLYLNGHGGITNTGLLEATDGGILQISNQLVNNSGGTVAANGGTVVISDSSIAYGQTLSMGSGEIEGGLVLANGGAIRFDNGEAVGSTLSSLNGGTLGVDSSYLARLSGVTLSTGNTWTAAQGSQTFLRDSLTNNGNFQIIGGGGNDTFLTVESNLTLLGAGFVTLNSGDNHGRAYIQSNGIYTLTNGDNMIQGYGNIGNTGMSFINGPSGTVNANVSGQTLIVSTIQNKGLLEATSGGTLQVTNRIINAGYVVVGGGSELDVGANGTNTYFQNAGQTLVANGGTLKAGMIQETGGTMQVDGILDPINIDLESGELGGTGTLYGDLSNRGHIILGDSVLDPGTLSLVGNFLQTDGVMFESIDDSSNGILDVTGNVGLTGWLDVGLLDGFTPVDGREFTFLKYSGTESGTLGVIGPASADWTVIYEPGFVELEFNRVSLNTVADKGMTCALLGVGLAGLGYLYRPLRRLSGQRVGEG
jgi:hypothetical protein